MERLDLVATVGPASEARIGDLVQAGATALRLNASHVPPGGLEAALAHIRAAAPGVPVVVDLQGAKMRLGGFAGRQVQRGSPVVLCLGAEGGDAVPVPHPELFAAVGEGDVLSCDDGRLRLEVLQVEPGRLRTRALDTARLDRGKGLNRLDHPVVLSGLTAVDAAFVDAAAGLPGLSFAFSFMTDGREADWVRDRAPGRPVIGKVERREATEALGELASRVDGVWICRGDLGAQLGAAGLARFVGRFDPRMVGVPVLMAGQVLQSLVHQREATRSEVCHLFDLLGRGYAGVVLSDETAVGADPVGAVAEAARLLRALG